jgi:hypothetical protein
MVATHTVLALLENAEHTERVVHTLLAVHTRQKEAPRAESILSQHGAQEIFRTV